MMRWLDWTAPRGAASEVSYQMVTCRGAFSTLPSRHNGQMSPSTPTRPWRALHKPRRRLRLERFGIRRPPIWCER